MEEDEPGQEAAHGGDPLGGQRAAALHLADWEDGVSPDKR